MSGQYSITIENYQTSLYCILIFDEKKYEARITIDDLKSGVVSINKLQNILKLNSQIVHPNYTIEFESKINNSNLVNYLILKIIYSDDFIDWDEKIYFTQSDDLKRESDNIRELKYCVESQQVQINNLKHINSKYESLIHNLTNRIDELEKKINLIDQEQILTHLVQICHGRGSPIFNVQGSTMIMTKNINININFDNCQYFIILQPKFSSNSHECYEYRLHYSDICCCPFRIMHQILSHTIHEINISICIDPNYDAKSKFIIDFINLYLASKPHIIIEKIKLSFVGSYHHCNIKQFSDVLIRYSNYKKIIFPYNAEYDSREFVRYCELNQIELIFSNE